MICTYASKANEKYNKKGTSHIADIHFLALH